MISLFKFEKGQGVLALKGFAMGVADIVPGVSGGTIAFITGIYDDLLESISKVNKDFVKLLLGMKIKEALLHINFPFLFPLLSGIFSAIILMSRVMHFLLENYPVQTWSLFFGLIGASIFFVGKQIKEIKSFKNIFSILIGTFIGYACVSLIPVQTEHSYINIFLSGAIAICAMILPGISGSFILLILGKYAFVTGALKQPFIENHLFVIITFCLGCLIGLLSFSKLLNWLLHHYHNLMMCILTGFMVGSMKKIWPWKKVLDSTVIREKTYVLSEMNIFPETLDLQFAVALTLMIIGFVLVVGLEKYSQES
jgi:putative membrane protein